MSKIEFKLIDAVAVSGFVKKERLPEKVDLNDYKEIRLGELLFTNLKYETVSNQNQLDHIAFNLDELYFSSKDCPCRYAFHFLHPILQLIDSWGIGYKILMPKKFKPMLVETDNGFFAIAHQVYDIWGKAK